MAIHKRIPEEIAVEICNAHIDYEIARLCALEGIIEPTADILNQAQAENDEIFTELGYADCIGI